MEIWVYTAILLISFYLLISEKMPIDLTAIGIMAALVLARILTPAEAVAGFAEPAVITVGAMFLISHTLIRTGVVGLIVQKMMDWTDARPWLAMPMVLLIVAAASAFINNTPVVVLFIPVILSLSCRLRFNPARFLLPMSYASILGGTCTLIGTSTNIIVSNLSDRYGYGALGMFELSTVGAAVALSGLVFILVTSRYLMPDLINATCEMENAQGRRYLAELSVPRGSSLVGMDPCRDLPALYPGLEVVELIRYSHIFHPCRDSVAVAPDDLLLVKGSPNTLMAIIHDKVVELPKSEKDLPTGGFKETLVVELIVTPQSSLAGQRLRETELARDDDLHIIAIERMGLHYTEKQIQDIGVKAGDILLAWCRSDKMEKFRWREDWVVVEDVHHKIVHKHKAPLACLIFGAMVVAASTGLADIIVCALTAAFLMMISGCLPLRDAYRALQGNVLLLIVGAVALGSAMDKTGASRFYAGIFLGAMHGLPPQLVLGGFLLLTSLFTQFLSNNATAVLLVPIAISTALGLHVNPKPFIMAVCFGASASFATPIGYQTNLLVYGPGGYRFSDYLKMGIPLNLVVLALQAILIPRFWPL